MVVETAEEEEARLAKEWADDGRKGRVLIRRSERRDGCDRDSDRDRACTFLVPTVILMDSLDGSLSRNLDLRVGRSPNSSLDRCIENLDRCGAGLYR